MVWEPYPFAERHRIAELGGSSGSHALRPRRLRQMGRAPRPLHPQRPGPTRVHRQGGLRPPHRQAKREVAPRWSCTDVWREPDIQHPAEHADCQRHAGPHTLTKPDTGSMELRVVRQYLACLHKLLQQQQPLGVPHLLRGQQQCGMHLALFWQQQPLVPQPLRRPQQPALPDELPRECANDQHRDFTF